MRNCHGFTPTDGGGGGDAGVLIPGLFLVASRPTIGFEDLGLSYKKRSLEICFSGSCYGVFP